MCFQIDWWVNFTFWWGFNVLNSSQTLTKSFGLQYSEVDLFFTYLRTDFTLVHINIEIKIFPTNCDTSLYYTDVAKVIG